MDCLFLTRPRHWWERVNNTVIEFHLSETSGLSRKRTRTAHLLDRDANDCAIPPPSFYLKITTFCLKVLSTSCSVLPCGLFIQAKIQVSINAVGISRTYVPVLALSFLHYKTQNSTFIDRYLQM